MNDFALVFEIAVLDEHAASKQVLAIIFYFYRLQDLVQFGLVDSPIRWRSKMSRNVHKLCMSFNRRFLA